jgi:hypothetical protein
MEPRGVQYGRDFFLIPVCGMGGCMCAGLPGRQAATSPREEALERTTYVQYVP